MGRNEKIHQEIHIRCDIDIYERMENFRNNFNLKYTPKLTRTQLIENALQEYLSKYEHLVYNEN